jgi:hypothetical protein
MMDTATGADGASRSASEETVEPREGDKPGVIGDVASGRVRPSVIEQGSDEDRQMDEAEKGALDWLLSAERPPPWEVEVQSLTPEGFKPLLFVVEPQDGRKIVEIEDRCTSGNGPLRKLDEIANNAELVAAATLYLEDPATGKKIDPSSPDFRGPIPSKATAIERRFARQAGLLMGVAGQIRSISGYNSDHVGKARHRAVSAELVSAVGGS